MFCFKKTVLYIKLSLQNYQNHLNQYIQVSTNFTLLCNLVLRGMFEMNCLFLSGDFKFQVSPKVLISCPRSTPRD